MQVDRDLVEAARNGDREAYADLIRARGDRLFAIAQRILRDVDRTEDAVQDALVIAWRDLPGLRDPDRFDAWLHRLLVRSCVSEATRERRLVANLRVLPADLPTGTDDYLTVADRDQLERGFRRLPPEQRALLVLRHYAGTGAGRDRRVTRHPGRHGPLPTPPCPPRDACRPRGGCTRDRDRRTLGMTRDRDIERVLEHWLSDGVNEMPDRVYQSIFDRVERQPQAIAPRLLRRLPAMNGSLRWIAAAAAVILIAVVGFAIVGRPSDSGIGTQPTAVPPTAAPSPTATATVAAPSPSVEVGVPGACDLMSDTEAAGALHALTTVIGLPPNGEDPAVPNRYCIYMVGDAQLVTLQYEKEDGVSIFDTWRSQTGVQPVPGLGDGAVWDPVQTTLHILKGSRLVSISSNEGAPPMTLETAKAIAAIVLGRM